MARLRYLDQAGHLQTINPGEGQFLIGRQNTCQIVFIDDMVSREHTRIDPLVRWLGARPIAVEIRVPKSRDWTEERRAAAARVAACWCRCIGNLDRIDKPLIGHIIQRLKQTDLERDGEKVGLVCQACGCQHFRVVYLQRLTGGVIRRRRECRHCGRRVTTTERATG